MSDLGFLAAVSWVICAASLAFWVSGDAAAITGVGGAGVFAVLTSVMAWQDHRAGV